MRIVLLCTAEHLGSYLVLNHLHVMRGVEIVGIVESPAVPLNQQGETDVYKYIKRIGWYFAWMLLWQGIVQNIGFCISRLLAVLTGNKYLVPVDAIAENKKIPVFRGDINSPAGEQFMRDLAPDLAVSAYFNKILKQLVINVPKHGVVNIHPGLLPGYRGVMSYFWVLKNKEQQAGVSLHWIDAGIDTGDVIASKAFRIGGNTTQQKILVKTAVLGARMLKSFIRRLKKGKRIRALPRPSGKPAYYPLPGSRDFEDYCTRHRFFRVRDVIRLMTRRLKFIR